MRHGSRLLSLRTAFAALTLSLTALGVLVAVLLMAVTSRLASSTAELVAVVESVRLAEEAELDLLLHDRTLEPVVKASLEAQLRERLVELAEHVTTAQEAEALESATAAVARYFAGASGAGASGPRLVTDAYDALAAVVAVNLDQSRAAQRRSERLSQGANAAGIGLMLAVPVLAAVGAGWLRSRTLRPVTDLTSAIRRFASGDRTVRADEAGPIELAEAARHFNELAAELYRQRETQRAFLAGVAHDLRSPLHGLKSAFEVLGTGDERTGEAMRRRAADVAGRQMERLERMIEDLLTTTLLDAGRLKLNLQEWDLRITARTCLELIRSSSGSHDLRLTVPDHAVLVHCDPLRMEQVIDNLVGNAVKYTPAGGRIHVALSGAGTDVELAVSDDGVGIATREQGHVFDAFSRVEATASAPGLGLGLFMSRKIVEAHGGSIELRSGRGRGTTFVVRLPREPAARDAAPGEAVH
jgi:signal transduction histidine kinase